MRQRTKTKHYLTFLALGTLGIGRGIFAQAVPQEYYPNYAIKGHWEKIQEYFVQIEAAQKI